MTAGIYIIENKTNSRCYVGSSKSIERRFESHLDALRKSAHHSWKLQKDFDAFGESVFRFATINTVKDHQDIELILEVLERAEVLDRDSVRTGYNVSDEIIRETSLVLAHCSQTLDLYFNENRESFALAIKRQKRGWIANLVTRLWKEESLDRSLDINFQAQEYLRVSLIAIFKEYGVSGLTASKLAESYVTDTIKMRDGKFRYYRGS